MNAILAWLWQLINAWGYLFVAPLQDLNTLWILIPVYLNWIVTEFYQEKKGTSYGNAISNGVVVLWVGVDWARTVVRMLSEGNLVPNADFFAKISISLLVIAYGAHIILSGIRVHKKTATIGKIRNVTYVCIMFTPIIYGLIPINAMNILAIAIFFPLYYYLVELLDLAIPDPKTYDEERKETEVELIRRQRQHYQAMHERQQEIQRMPQRHISHYPQQEQRYRRP